MGLEAEIDRLNGQLQEFRDKNKMQLEQINGLLMEKVTLQTESIGVREKMLEREKVFGCASSLVVRYSLLTFNAGTFARSSKERTCLKRLKLASLHCTRKTYS